MGTHRKSFWFYIDYGSRGNSGFYSREILENINLDINLLAFLNSGYIYTTKWECYKVFERGVVGDIAPIRNILKLVDLHFSFLFVWMKILLCRSENKIVIVNLYQPFRIYNFFHRLIKINSNTKLLVVVHDATPFTHKYPSLLMASQSDILSKADYFIAHNNFTINELKLFNKHIFLVPFPVMYKKELLRLCPNRIIRFLFIGHLRLEKGIQLLIDAWREISRCYRNVELTIAGSLPFGIKYDTDSLDRCTSLFSFQSDEDYEELIGLSDYVVLPYTAGTNSGVLSTVTKHIKPVITSDIPMFRESPLVFSNHMFAAGNCDSLVNVMKSVIDSHEIQYPLIVTDLLKIIEFQRNIFCDELNKALHEIVTKENVNA